MYRLYVDEHGTDDLKHVEEDHERYLSLTGLAMKISHARDELKPKFDWIKANVFDHDPDDPIIFHRRSIMQRKGCFGLLNDDSKRDLFDRSMLRAMSGTEYNVITAMIDKQAMLGQAHWRNKHPYHYLMEVLVEKYTQFLERKGSTGDIMPEARKGEKDKNLQQAFFEVRQNGTYFISASRIQTVIPSSNLKFRAKVDNIDGLQLCDLLAHPSHYYVRQRQGHAVNPGNFCVQVQQILTDHKYDRSNSGIIMGYGIKWLP